MVPSAEGELPKRPKRNVAIFLVGLVCLMVELLHTRMLAFFLGSISNFLAIPVALFGLALGSLLVHHKRTGDARRLIAHVQKTVYEKHGILLEPEVVFVGDFDEPLFSPT